MRESSVINEVGLRDGLQNQSRPVSSAQKLTILDALLAAGNSRGRNCQLRLAV